MTKQLSEYEIEKQKKKQEVVRNEFLFQNNSCGKYEFPKIKKQDIDVNKIEFLSYVNAKIDDNKNKNKTKKNSRKKPSKKKVEKKEKPAEVKEEKAETETKAETKSEEEGE